MTDKAINYKGLVVVAEAEWKFDYGNFETNPSKILPVTVCASCWSTKSCGDHNKIPNCSSCHHPFQFSLNPRTTKQSLKMGFVEWNIAFNDQAKALEFNCQSLEAEGAVKEVHMELVWYWRSEPNESYEKKETKRHIFSRSANSLYTNILYCRDNLFTIRILKNRSMFPDFKLENTVVERSRSNGKLRVGDQVFHINKQLLSMHSEVFDRMFNSQFKEATQEEVELKHEQPDAAVFHDFLLLMFVPDALPNPGNVAALCDLANMYETNSVRNKCRRHLTMCREMPLEERYVLAEQIGNEELKNSIMGDMANLEEARQVIAAVSKKAFSSC